MVENDFQILCYFPLTSKKNSIDYDFLSIKVPNISPSLLILDCWHFLL